MEEGEGCVLNVYLEVSCSLSPYRLYSNERDVLE